MVTGGFAVGGWGYTFEILCPWVLASEAWGSDSVLGSTGQAGELENDLFAHRDWVDWLRYFGCGRWLLLGIVQP